MMNIHIGNLPDSASEDQLRELFERFGAVQKVTLTLDPDTDRPRGFGFVEMTDDDAGRRAIEELHGWRLHNSPLTVHEAAMGDDTTGTG